MATKPERIINIHGHLRHDQDLAARMRCWQEWNVERFVCLCLHPRWAEEGYFTNDDLIAARDRLGDVVVGFAAVGVAEIEGVDGADAIDRYAEQGFVGLKILAPSRPLSDEIYFPIYERAEQLGLPILFHTGFLGTQAADAHYSVDSENMRPYRFDRLARSFPKLKIIGAHLGGPHYHEALVMIESHANVYYDFSGGSGHQPHLRKVASAMLPHPSLATDMADPQQNRALVWFEKLLFGTDNPEPDVWVPGAQWIMDRLEIPDALRRRFFYDNAAALLDPA